MPHELCHLCLFSRTEDSFRTAHVHMIDTYTIDLIHTYAMEAQTYARNDGHTLPAHVFWIEIKCFASELAGQKERDPTFPSKVRHFGET